MSPNRTRAYVQAAAVFGATQGFLIVFVVWTFVSLLKASDWPVGAQIYTWGLYCMLFGVYTGTLTGLLAQRAWAAATGAAWSAVLLGLGLYYVAVVAREESGARAAVQGAAVVGASCYPLLGLLPAVFTVRALVTKRGARNEAAVLSLEQTPGTLTPYGMADVQQQGVPLGKYARAIIGVALLLVAAGLIAVATGLWVAVSAQR